MARDKLDSADKTKRDIEQGHWSEQDEDKAMDDALNPKLTSKPKKSKKSKEKKMIDREALHNDFIRRQKYALSTKKSGAFNRSAVNAQMMGGFGSGLGFLTDSAAYGTLTTGVIVFAVSASSFFKNSAKLCIPPMNYSTHTVVGLAMSLLGMFLGTSLAAVSVTSLALDDNASSKASVELALKVAYVITVCFVLYQKFLYKKDKEQTPTPSRDREGAFAKF